MEAKPSASGRATSGEFADVAQDGQLPSEQMLHGAGQWSTEGAAVAGRDHQHADSQRGHQKETLGDAPHQTGKPESGDDGRRQNGADRRHERPDAPDERPADGEVVDPEGAPRSDSKSEVVAVVTLAVSV